jgi:hypothetical protein
VPVLVAKCLWELASQYKHCWQGHLSTTSLLLI